MPLFRARGFGLDWQADIALSQFDPLSASPESPDIVVSRVTQLARRMAPLPMNRGALYSDGFRFGWSDQVTFDVFDGDRIEYCTGAGWRDELPAAFFSTVTGLTLAWRGLLSLHATAVAISGRAILLAGQAGAGKSTLAAELLQRGAQLLSDDLTVIGQDNENLVPMAFRGRQSIRLHPATASEVDSLRCDPVPDDPRGKFLVWPRQRFNGDGLPVAGLILLGDQRIAPANPPLANMLSDLIFRPAWTAAIPVQSESRTRLLGVVSSAPVRQLPRINGFSAAQRARRVDIALSAIAEMTA